jgi:hypothetical protein
MFACLNKFVAIPQKGDNYRWVGTRTGVLFDSHVEVRIVMLPKAFLLQCTFDDPLVFCGSFTENDLINKFLDAAAVALPWSSSVSAKELVV